MTKTELLRLVRQKCLSCCCGSAMEVEKCPIPDCELYTVRFGKDPTKRELSPERREVLVHARKIAKERKMTLHTQKKKDDTRKT